MGYILKLHSGLVWQTIILHKGYMCEIEQNSIIMWAETYKVQISHWSHKGSNNEVLKFPINLFYVKTDIQQFKARAFHIRAWDLINVLQLLSITVNTVHLFSVDV